MKKREIAWIWPYGAEAPIVSKAYSQVISDQGKARPAGAVYVDKFAWNVSPDGRTVLEAHYQKRVRHFTYGFEFGYLNETDLHENWPTEEEVKSAIARKNLSIINNGR